MSANSRRYSCLNPRCPAYVGLGVALTDSQVRVDSGHLRCNACGSYVQLATPQDGSNRNDPLAGLAVGAALGAAVGGPSGALIGALLGLMAASGSAKSK